MEHLKAYILALKNMNTDLQLELPNSLMPLNL